MLQQGSNAPCATAQVGKVNTNAKHAKAMASSETESCGRVFGPVRFLPNLLIPYTEMQNYSFHALVNCVRKRIKESSARPNSHLRDATTVKVLVSFIRNRINNRSEGVSFSLALCPELVSVDPVGKVIYKECPPLLPNQSVCSFYMVWNYTTLTWEVVNPQLAQSVFIESKNLPTETTYKPEKPLTKQKFKTIPSGSIQELYSHVHWKELNPITHQRTNHVHSRYEYAHEN